MKKQQLLSTFIILLCLGLSPIIGQEKDQTDLYKTLKSKDSLLFDVGFNTCNLAAFEKLLADDLEFYHDKSGVTNSKGVFMDNFQNGLCGNPNFKSRRALVSGTLKVYPLHHNGKLYGAIQTGEHRFFETQKGKPETPGSIAKFTHLWLLEAGHWKIKRVLSYDHQMKQTPSSKTEIQLPQTLLESYVGTYQAKETGMIKISLNQSVLEMKAGTMEALIYPESETIFFHKQAPLTFEFMKDAKGKILKFVVSENGKVVEEAIRIE